MERYLKQIFIFFRFFKKKFKKKIPQKRPKSDTTMSKGEGGHKSRVQFFHSYFDKKPNTIFKKKKIYGFLPLKKIVKNIQKIKLIHFKEKYIKFINFCFFFKPSFFLDLFFRCFFFR